MQSRVWEGKWKSETDMKKCMPLNNDGLREIKWKSYAKQVHFPNAARQHLIYQTHNITSRERHDMRIKHWKYSNVLQINVFLHINYNTWHKYCYKSCFVQPVNLFYLTTCRHNNDVLNDQRPTHYNSEWMSLLDKALLLTLLTIAFYGE